jgi:hypothetical protein
MAIFNADAQINVHPSGASFGFDGDETANCGVTFADSLNALIPSYTYTNDSYTATFNDGSLVLDKSSSAETWHKAVLQFPNTSLDFVCHRDTTINLSDKSDHKFYMKVNNGSLDTIKQCLVMFFDEGGNYTDAAPWEQTLYPGDNVVEFNSEITWKTWPNIDEEVFVIDSSAVVGFALYFRNAWNDAGVAGTFTIDSISVGNVTNEDGNRPLTASEVVVEGFNVYPNPASDVLNIKFNAKSETFVNLMDLTGKIVASQNAQVGAVTTAFQIADLNAGIYFVNVKSVNGSATQKVVIK